MGVALSLGIAMVLWVEATRADSPDHGVRLIDHAADAAVFEAEGGLHRIAIGQIVPGTGATLRHVSSSGIQIEYPANADTQGGFVLIERGGMAPAALPRDEQAVIPSVQITPLAPIAPGTKAAPARRADTGRSPRQ